MHSQQISSKKEFDDWIGIALLSLVTTDPLPVHIFLTIACATQYTLEIQMDQPAAAQTEETPLNNTAPSSVQSKYLFRKENPLCPSMSTYTIICLCDKTRKKCSVFAPC